MTEAVLYHAGDQGIVTLTLNRPELRNAISDEDMVLALLAALDRLQNDRSARVAILTGAGSAFSSGGNLKKMGSGGGLNDPQPVRTRLNYRNGIQKLPLAFEALEIPVIAAVNGPAIGAGCDLTLMCDLRIASEKASFAENFVKIGLIPGDGGTWLLPRVVGFSKASEMALTGEGRCFGGQGHRAGLGCRAAWRIAGGRASARPAHRREPALCGANDQAAPARSLGVEARASAGDGG